MKPWLNINAYTRLYKDNWFCCQHCCNSVAVMQVLKFLGVHGSC